MKNYGIGVTWSEVSVFVRSTSGFFLTNTCYKKVLNNVSGAVQPGSLVAIMGGSGAGKSTLMSALAHRTSAGMLVDGDIRINGHPIGEYMRHISGFMHQEDLFVGALTVREHLTLMAQLRIDRRVSKAEKNRKIKDLLEEMGLASCADTRIGDRGTDKVLSGGEKKRLAFATEMLTDPPLLFCDEPTSGLDSFSAQKLVHLMKLMASQGKTIICTIHQPSSEIFELFHRLILMADGRIVFVGNVDSGLEFFSRLGHNCETGQNVAEWLIRMLALPPGSEENGRRTIKRLCSEYQVSDSAKEIELTINLEQHMGASCEVSEDITKFDIKSAHWWTQMYCLTMRSVITVFRDPTIQKFNIIQKLVVAVMAGLCFAGSINFTQTGIQSVQGVLFILISENAFPPMYSVLSLFPQEMPLLQREYRSGLYSISPYYLSKLVAMFPGIVIEAGLYGMVLYWIAGLRPTFLAFIITMLLAIATLNISIACGFFFSCAFGSVPLAIACLVPFDYILMITSGLFIQLNSLPEMLSWLKFLSWIMYSNEAMSVIQWEGVSNITCDPELPCLSSGAEVLQHYGFSVLHFWPNVIAMGVLYTVFHLLSYLSLSIRAKH